jgi:hypothetical protein
MSAVEARLSELGLSLPPVMVPKGANLNYKMRTCCVKQCNAAASKCCPLLDALLAYTTTVLEHTVELLCV